MKKIILLLQVALTLGCMQIFADNNVIVASTNPDHPYARGQWTKAQAEAWQKKYGAIIGVNHPTGPTPQTSRLEYLRKAKELGYNSVRFWVGGSDGDAYIRNLKSWATDCASLGMTISPVISWPNGAASSDDPTTAFKTVETNLRKVIAAFRNDDRIILWDIWNEPSYGDNEQTTLEMTWLQKMVEWCREEGCTQPITASVIWDAGISAASRTSKYAQLVNETEAMMDIHNYHDYIVAEEWGRNTKVMVDRLKKISDRPLVCTECLARTRGATMQRTLGDFAKYHINFYTWGLYANDSNWEVQWGRSTYYAWEPLFHDILYSDGEPYKPDELPWVAKFRFLEDGENWDPGAAYTERWAERRAWKFENHAGTRGLYYNSLDEAIAGVAQHASDGLYNSVSVKFSFNDYAASSSSYLNKFRTLLTSANAAGMTVLPILLNGNDITKSASLLQSYAYNIINSFYTDRRIAGWNIYQQTSSGAESAMTSKMPDIMNYVRYTFPNQPMFITPLVSSATVPDSTARDMVNQMWQFSDIIAYNTADGSSLTEAFTDTLAKAYNRPIIVPQVSSVPSHFAKNHIHWYATTAPAESAVKAFQFEPSNMSALPDTGRWAGWQTWAWMNRPETKGVYYASLSAALNAIDALGQGGIYNSMRVHFDYSAYTNDRQTFFNNVDTLLSKAGRYNLTILPTLLADKNSSIDDDALVNYVGDVVARYAQNKHIIAWDLYFRPGANYTGNARLLTLIPALFEAARAKAPIQPLFCTPSVSVKTVDDDYIKITTHGASYAESKRGWNMFQYTLGSSAALVYNIWCLSDVIGFMTTQKSPEMGMLEGVTYRFGRPLFCTQWKTTSTEDPGKNAAFFKNMHTNWYVNGTLPDTLVTNFKFLPVQCGH